MAKVLIVEDDAVIARGMTEHLGAAGFDAVSLERGDIALARLRYEKPDVCVLDLMVPGLDGWSVIETARAEGIGTPIVVVSALETRGVNVTVRDTRGRDIEAACGQLALAAEGAAPVRIEDNNALP